MVFSLFIIFILNYEVFTGQLEFPCEACGGGGWGFFGSLFYFRFKKESSFLSFLCWGQSSKSHTFSQTNISLIQAARLIHVDSSKMVSYESFNFLGLWGYFPPVCSHRCLVGLAATLGGRWTQWGVGSLSPCTVRNLCVTCASPEAWPVMAACWLEAFLKSGHPLFKGRP